MTALISAVKMRICFWPGLMGVGKRNLANIFAVEVTSPALGGVCKEGGAAGWCGVAINNLSVCPGPGRGPPGGGVGIPSA